MAKFFDFIIKLLGFFTLGCLLIILGFSVFVYDKYGDGMTMVQEVRTTYTKVCGDVTEILIKNNVIYCDGVKVKKVEE